MAAFHSLPKASLLALVAAGGAIPGDVYFANDTGETFLAMTGQPNPGIAPLSSLILTGEYQLAGPPSTVPGPAGPTGPAQPLSTVIAMAVALG
jgi:hypothetical protein